MTSVVQAGKYLTFEMCCCSASNCPSQTFETASAFKSFRGLDRDLNRAAAAARASKTCFDRTILATASIANVGRDDRLPRTSVVKVVRCDIVKAKGEEEA